MTANPDSALRQALVAAEKALEPFAQFDDEPTFADDRDASITTRIDERSDLVLLSPDDLTLGDLRRAREAHALITEALQRGEKT